MLRFFMPCVPPKATAQQKGAFVMGGRVRFFKKKTVRDSENLLAAMLQQHVPPEPFAGPVSLHVAWIFPYRKSEKKAVVAAGKDIPHTVRPDLDNLEKSLLDVMTALRFWNDDSQVATKVTVKRWGPRPGIEVTVLESC